MKRCFRAFNTPLLPPYRRYPMPSSYRNVARNAVCNQVFALLDCTIRHRRLSPSSSVLLFTNVLLQLSGKSDGNILGSTVSWFLNTIGLIPGMMGTVMLPPGIGLRMRNIFHCRKTSVSPSSPPRSLLSLSDRKYPIPYWGLLHAFPDSKPFRKRTVFHWLRKQIRRWRSLC